MLKRKFLHHIPALILLAMTLAALAAPKTPAKMAPPDTLLSLAGLTRVRLQFVPFVPELTDAGITHERIEKAWRIKLIRAGIEIIEADEPDAPGILLGVSYELNDDVPDGASALAVFSLRELMHHSGLDRDLYVPAYFVTTHALGSKSDLPEEFAVAMENMIDTFIRAVRAATAWEEQK